MAKKPSMNKAQIDRMVEAAAIISSHTVDGYVEHIQTEARIMYQAARLVQIGEDAVALLTDKPELLDVPTSEGVQAFIDGLKAIRKERLSDGEDGSESAVSDGEGDESSESGNDGETDFGA